MKPIADSPPGVLSVATAALDRLMPMHLHVGGSGHILHVGPTIARLRPDAQLLGARLLDLFEFRRPSQVSGMAALVALDGSALRCQFRAPPHVALKGIVVCLPGTAGVLLNLSLGISVVEAVGTYQLTSSDFAPSDLTVEMLYLIEARAVVFEEFRKLSQRLQGARATAEQQANTDPLTGLMNRRALDDALARLATSRRREPFGLMHVDLDYFKAVNDTFGHAAGDRVLQEVSRIMLAETRAGDMVARVGGDEFVLLVRNCDDTRVLDGIARRIIARLEEPIDFEGQACRVSASIGTTFSSRYAKLDMARLSSDADEALYASKAEGRARHTIFSRPAMGPHAAGKPLPG